MSAAERLEAAIDKLERLKAESAPGEWFIGNANADLPMEYRPLWVVSTVQTDYAEQETPDDHFLELHTGVVGDAAVIVTLHRTIDAQIAILREGLLVIAAWQDPDSEVGYERDLDGEYPASMDSTYLALADAILGCAA